jgi:multidrug efflux pump
MLGVTLFGIFLTPVFYFVIQWVTERFYGPPAARIEAPTDVLPEAHGH